MRGLLIAFEGLDQSGKQTQAERLRDRVVEAGRLVRLLSFPAYDTAIGTEIGRALQGDRDYGPDVMQLLYVANRYEWKPQIEFELGRGTVLICDRYLASSIAYGEAQGLDPAWLIDVQKYLPQPDITFLLDIDPEVSASRKTADRDKYERDLALLGRVRGSYMRQAATAGWTTLDANRDREAVAVDVWKIVSPRVR
ncbi:MAG TPA: dTMP kinase [Vicinamibacterales bacterium]|jgi:dTMP kinase|nr:dTMP kinase [Vicinamibacterales bacterium]